MYKTVLALIVVCCAVLDTAVGLQCYECSNQDNAKCGKSFDLTFKEAEEADFVKTCVGDSVACRKTESTDSLNNKLIFTRSCWNTSTPLDEEFFDCKELMSSSTVCYCKDGDKGKPCNGQETLRASWVFIALGLPLLFLGLLF